MTTNATNITALQQDALQWNSMLGAYDASHGGGSPQRITNVAPGVNPTDAATVSQLPGQWQGSNTFVMGNSSSTGPVTITNVADLLPGAPSRC